MPKFRVHVYPIYRTAVNVEADSPEAAYERAETEVLKTLTEIGNRHSVGWMELEFADGVSGGLVDVLDENRERTHSVNIGQNGKVESRS